MAFLDNVKSTIQSLVFGSIGDSPLPARNQVPPWVDGRTEALRTLFEYLSEITIYRSNGTGRAPIAMRIPYSDMHIQWPQNADEVLTFPAIGILPGEGQHIPIGLSPAIDETTIDTYGMGTVLWRLWEYQEDLQLELWASSPAERAAMVQGIELALSPSENVSNLRLRMDNYFGTSACFTLLGAIRVEDGDAAKERRRALMRVRMRYEILRLGRYNRLMPTASVSVLTPDEELPEGSIS